MQMATFIRGSFRRTWPTVLDTTFTLMAVLSVDSGATTDSMGKGSSAGPMGQNLKAHTIMVTSKVMEFSPGLMEMSTREISNRATSKEKVFAVVS